MIFLGNGIINYLEDICFEIGRRYCFDFDAICTDGDHLHIFVVSEPKYSFLRVMKISEKISQKGKSLKSTPVLKTFMK